MSYGVGPSELAPYLAKANELLVKKGREPLTIDQLTSQTHQLKLLVDICHVYGIAVLFDVVYNHAGGGFDAQSIDYFDFSSKNLYFSDASWAGGRVFDYQKPEVRQFLIGNAHMFLREYHADGIRFDEVSAMDQNGGWFFCQDLTTADRSTNPAAVQIAEYWASQPWLSMLPVPQGMGFDIGYADGIRNSVRQLVVDASGGNSAAVPIGVLKPALEGPANFPNAWRAYNCIENHDLVLDMDGDHRYPRIAKLADPSDPRSWYARSRARNATALLLTAPGVPMIFMGQEFLAQNLWSDNPHRSDLFLWWDGVEGQDRHMVDFRRFAKEAIALRRRQPALRSEGRNVFHVDEFNRVLAFQRWVPDVGRDVVVVVSFRESTFYANTYQIGFPQPGYWHEVFNSDYYDNFPNPQVAGNDGGVVAGWPPADGLPYSAMLTIPANSVLVFARD
jgi:1,4-alpha-glucan branching enzyme